MHVGQPPFAYQFPKPLPKDEESTFQEWVLAHQDKFSEYDRAIDEIVISHRITEANGSDLEEIGRRFGQIGRRRGRGNEEYRQFLLSIAESYSGRGTRPGMQFAISAGVRAEAETVGIEEHFDENEYSVTLTDWIAHQVSTIHELADLADPSGVNLRTPIKYNYAQGEFGLSANEVVRGATVTIPDAGVGFSATDTTVRIQSSGAGAGRFDGEDPFGEGVQIGQPGADAGEESYSQSSYSESSYPGDDTDLSEQGPSDDDSGSGN